MSIPFTSASRVADIDDQAHAFLRAHSKRLRALQHGQTLDLKLPGTGETHLDRIVTRRDSYAATIVAVRQLADDGVRITVLTTPDGLRLVRLREAGR
jgi:hypothetical protein